MPQPLRTILWTYEPDASTEYCHIQEIDAGFQFNGTVVMRLNNAPLRLDYEILTSWDWRTQRVDITLFRGVVEDRVTLRVDAEQRWWSGDEEIVACRGCIDVDLSFTPATNTLVIRRLALSEQESATVTTAWLQLPDLNISAFPQQYTRLSVDEYLFTSLNSDFKAKLRVDDVGLVRHYEGLWHASAYTS